MAAVIAVEDSANVILRNLTIDGADNRLTACAPTLVGVFYRNASGEVQSTAVRDIRLGPTLGDCQSGYGIFAQSGAGGVSKLTVNGSSVHGYQKVGILGNEDRAPSSRRWPMRWRATASPTIIAQNGIQIGFGATGSITRNSVVNHVYTCPTFPCDASTNILVFESNNVTVRGNQTAKAVDRHLPGPVERQRRAEQPGVRHRCLRRHRRHRQPQSRPPQPRLQQR